MKKIIFFSFFFPSARFFRFKFENFYSIRTRR